MAALAPETKGRPLEAIRLYWENGGPWPDDAALPGRFERRGAGSPGERVS